MSQKENIVGEYISITNEYKAKYGDFTILLLQVGAFMEMYALSNCVDKTMSTNIEHAIQLCGLNLADKKQQFEAKDGKKYPVMMAGFRDYMIEKYLKILTDNGYTAIVYVQQKSGKSFIRVIDSVHSPGTHIGYEIETISNRPNTNNIMCIWMETYSRATQSNTIFVCGIANIDCITGTSAIFEYQTPFILNPTMCDELERMVTIYNPNEVIVISGLSRDITSTALKYAALKTQNIHYKDLTNSSDKTLQNIQQEKYIKQLLAVFYDEDAYDICSEFKENPISTQAFCYLLHFVQSCNQGLIKKIAVPTIMNTSTRVLLANHTLKQLNIIDDASLDGGSSGHLSSVMAFLNRCQTACGKRRFRSQLTTPVFDEPWLNREYEMIRIFTSDETYEIVSVIRKLLYSTYDIEKIARQLILRKIYPSTIFYFNKTLEEIYKIGRIIENTDQSATISKYLYDTANITDQTTKCMKFINMWLVLEQCRGLDSIQNFDENIIRAGMSVELDTINKKYTETKELFSAIHSYFNELMHKYDNTAGSSNNTEYIKVHETEKSGVSLVITKKRAITLRTNLSKDPAIVRDEIVIRDNKIRVTDIKFITTTGSNDEISFPLLTKVCHDLLAIKDELNTCIAKTFQEFLVAFEEQWYDKIEQFAKYVSKIDVLQSKAYIAKEYCYCCPEINSAAEKSCVVANDLRHVLIEQIQQKEIYVANDITIGSENQDGMLIYGTNAVGKTSFIRALGVSVILAQAGMFVPATRFCYKPYQSIYTRILGNDNLFKGLSTFAVEMSELRVILKMADANSLVLGDELCSGTETESALSIFVAGLSHLHDKQSSFLFATHFHEILKYDEIQSLQRMRVFHLAVVYSPELDTLVYERKLKPGSGSRLYGLEVCKSLYLPPEFLEKAHQLRVKYFPDTRGELENPIATYNAQKVRGLCEMCGINMGEEIHHLQEQHTADANGFVHNTGNGVFHKNHPANLISVCEKCHDSIHVKSASNITSISTMKSKMVKKKTLNGYRIV